jgi:hypothetical protein
MQLAALVAGLKVLATIAQDTIVTEQAADMSMQVAHFYRRNLVY